MSPEHWTLPGSPLRRTSRTLLVWQCVWDATSCLSLCPSCHISGDRSPGPQEDRPVSLWPTGPGGGPSHCPGCLDNLPGVHAKEVSQSDSQLDHHSVRQSASSDLHATTFLTYWGLCRSYQTKRKAAKAMKSAAAMSANENQKTGAVVPGTNKYTMEGWGQRF